MPFFLFLNRTEHWYFATKLQKKITFQVRINFQYNPVKDFIPFDSVPINVEKQAASWWVKLGLEMSLG